MKGKWGVWKEKKGGRKACLCLMPSPRVGTLTAEGLALYANKNGSLYYNRMKRREHLRFDQLWTSAVDGADGRCRRARRRSGLSTPR